jgi:SAM-dependent methyltransferase
MQGRSPLLASLRHFLSSFFPVIYHTRVNMSLSSDDFARKIFFDIHNDFPRQGPGSFQSTLRALRSIDPNDKHLSILDIACGPGTDAIELARLGHNVTAIYQHEPFIKILLTRAKEENLSDRITTLVGDMFCLENFVAPNTFDVIWSAGAIYIIGFERGLTEWKKFLNKGGYLICPEVSWLTTDPPNEIRQFWSKNYPGMHSSEENFEIIKKCGYELINSFILNESDWNEYYGPMQKQMEELKLKYKEHEEAEHVLYEQQTEIDLYKKYSKSYSYVFYIMKK